MGRGQNYSPDHILFGAGNRSASPVDHLFRYRLASLQDHLDSLEQPAYLLDATGKASDLYTLLDETPFGTRYFPAGIPDKLHDFPALAVSFRFDKRRLLPPAPQYPDAEAYDMEELLHHETTTAIRLAAGKCKLNLAGRASMADCEPAHLWVDVEAETKTEAVVSAILMERDIAVGTEAAEYGVIGCW